ncbi:hypothetical protein L1987_13577 [Smallanthus sonchifolius]|uniref:Uncharacterized protein n=1 Tax=Smallanthus sonchifolius TaxID=185202 RepID=A0ACB9JGX3_9ASTR|nr:hypothetical protein L1987_13577 [Smallanthus sonchifolius]
MNEVDTDAFESENGSVGKRVDWVIVEDDELSEELFVNKNANIPRENCILVKPDVPVVSKAKVLTVMAKPNIPKTFKKIHFVTAGDMNQEVQKIEHISNSEFIENKIFEKVEKYERESKDSFFRRKFVKKPQQSSSRGFVGNVHEVDSKKQHGKRLIDPSLARPFVKPKVFVNEKIVQKPKQVVKKKFE